MDVIGLFAPKDVLSEHVGAASAAKRVQPALSVIAAEAAPTVGS